MVDYNAFFRGGQGVPSPVDISRRELDKAVQSAQRAVIYSPAPLSSNKYDEIFRGIQARAEGKTSGIGGGIIGSLAKGGLKALEGVGYVLGTPARAVASAGQELIDVYKGELPSVTDFVSQTFDPTFYPSKILPKSGNRWVDTVVGLGADIALDPLTYVGLGAASAAGRSGRIALAGKYARTAEQWGTKAAKQKLDDIVRYGEWALDDVEREFMELPKGLRFQWGQNAPLFDPTTTAGKVSGVVAESLGKPLARVRATIGDIPGLAKAQEFVRPRTYGGTLNRLGRGANLDNIDVIGEVGKYSAGVYGRAQNGLTRELIYGDNIDLVNALDNNPFSESVYQVLDGSAQASGRVIAPEEQALADQITALNNSGRDIVNNEVIVPFNDKRGVNAYQIGFIEDFGFSRSLTPEAANYVRTPKFGGSRWDSQIGDLIDVSPAELVTGTPVMRARKLAYEVDADGNPITKTWLGENLSKPEDFFVDNLNRISEEKLGFKWFKTDAKSLVGDYVDSLARQAGRIAFVDRLFDYGSDVVDRLIPKLVPDERLAKEASAVIRALKDTQQVIADGIDNLQGRALAQAEQLAGRANIRIGQQETALSAARLNTTKLQRMVAETRRRLLRARRAAAKSSDAIRQSFEEVLQPLEARVQELERTLASANADEETGMALLRSLHVRAFPEMDDAARPTTIAEFTQQLTDEAERRFSQAQEELLARQAAGEDITRSLAGQKGALTRQTKAVSEAGLMAEEGKISATVARGELRSARGKFTKEFNRLEKALANDPTIGKMRTLEEKYAVLVNDFNQAKLFEAELQSWVDNVLPVLDSKIDSVRRLKGARTGQLYTKVSGETFHKAITDAGEVEKVITRRGPGGATQRFRQKVRSTLTIYSPEEYKGFETYLSLDGKTGFAVKVDPEDGLRDLVSVFSVSPRRSAFGEAMEDAISVGRPDKLDAYDQNGFLPKRYAKYGFVETGRDKWNDAYAPEGWNKAINGEPDIVYMRRQPTEAEAAVPTTLAERREPTTQMRFGTGKAIRSVEDINTQWSDVADSIFAGINDPAILNDAQRDAWTRVFKQLKAQEVSLGDTEARTDLAQAVLKRFNEDPGEFGRWVNDVKDGWVAIEGLGIQMPRQLRDELFARMDEMTTLENVKQFTKIFDQYARFFRITAMFTPGFIVRNSLTAAFNNLVYGATAADIADGIAFARNVHTRGLRAALNAVPDDLRAEYEAAYRAVMASGGGQTWEITTQAVASGKPSRILDSKPVRLWSKVNIEAELGARMGMGLRSVRRGNDIEQTAATIAFFHFDYSAMSRLDETAKVFVPFWTFASRNIPLQITMQISRPAVYRAYESFQRNMPVDENMVLPGWLARRQPLGLTGGVVLNPDLPQLDMEDQVRQFVDPLRLLSQLYPQYRLPIELAGNRQLGLDIPFSEKPQPVRGPLDLPAMLVGALTGTGVDTAQGPALSSKLAYGVSSALPTLSTLQRLFPQLGGPEKYGERQLSSIATTIGLPIREVPIGEQERELLRRQFAIKDYLDSLRRRGYIESGGQ